MNKTKCCFTEVHERAWTFLGEIYLNLKEGRSTYWWIWQNSGHFHRKSVSDLFDTHNRKTTQLLQFQDVTTMHSEVHWDTHICNHIHCHRNSCNTLLYEAFSEPPTSLHSYFKLMAQFAVRSKRLLRISASIFKAGPRVVPQEAYHLINHHRSYTVTLRGSFNALSYPFRPNIISLWRRCEALP